MIIVVDDREKRPLHFPPEFPTEERRLDAGDYTVKGLEDLIAIERKSLADLLHSISHDRERFVRELRKLRSYQFSAIVVEDASWDDLLMGQWAEQVTPNQVIGSLLSFVVTYGVVPVLCGDRQTATRVVTDLLRLFVGLLTKRQRAATKAEELA